MAKKFGADSARFPAGGGLGEETLRGLRKAIQEAQSRGHAPIESLMALQPSVASGASLHLDFSAAKILGQPLVVVRPGREFPAWWSLLSKREKEVASLMAKGMSNRDIAEELGIAMSTAKDHVHQVLRKSGKKSRGEIAGALNR